MKKILSIIAVAFMAISASAQSEAGSLSWKPNVGITYSTATGDAGKGVDGRIGLTAGVEAMYMVNEKLGVAAGLNYTGYNTGYDEEYHGEKYSVSNTCYYFHIPITANYYVSPGLALKAGLAFNILASAKMSDDEESEDVKDYYNSTFISIPVGASYEMSNGLVFDLRYSLGVSDVGKGGSGSFNSLMFTVGYKF